MIRLQLLLAVFEILHLLFELVDIDLESALARLLQ